MNKYPLCVCVHCVHRERLARVGFATRAFKLLYEAVVARRIYTRTVFTVGRCSFDRHLACDGRINIFIFGMETAEKIAMGRWGKGWRLNTTLLWRNLFFSRCCCCFAHENCDLLQIFWAKSNCVTRKRLFALDAVGAFSILFSFFRANTVLLRMAGGNYVSQKQNNKQPYAVRATYVCVCATMSDGGKERITTGSHCIGAEDEATNEWDK